MKVEDYNGDSICRSLGLGQFVDPSWKESKVTAIRAVLRPSFHPEVVITITKTGEDVLASMIAARSRIWALPFPRAIDSDADQASVQPELFLTLVRIFEAALAESKIERRSICVDGMGVESCLVSGSEVKQLKAHVSGSKSADEFVLRVTQLAWDHCQNARVKNALSSAAAYVGLKIPEVQLDNSRPKQPVGIIILGTPEAKDGLLEAIQNRGKRRKE